MTSFVIQVAKPLESPRSANTSLRILALTKYGDMAASTRQRFVQFKDYLAQSGFQLHLSPLLDNSYLEATFAGRKANLFQLATCLSRRAWALIRQGQFDIVWVQKEIFPFLPGLIESTVLQRHIPVIVDYDDAVFHQYDLHRSPFVRKLMGRKLEPLLRRADLVVSGNAYLQAYAARHCRNVTIVPTVLDTTLYSPGALRRTHRPITVGWIGSPSTWAYVEPLVPLLQTAAEELNLTIRIIGAGPKAKQSPRFELLGWSQATEVAMIQEMDIGIMPLPDEPWARGKCGYKLLQYMACGLPVVASPVGTNVDIVDHRVNGFLARNETEWFSAIRCLATNPELRKTMGAHGRAKIERDYSIHVHGPRLACMFHEIAFRNRG